MAVSKILVLSTHYRNIPEVVEDGVTGLLAKRGAEGLASRLRWLIEYPNKMRCYVGGGAQACGGGI